MKKLTTFLLILGLLATMLVALAVPAFAAEKDFMADYFPSGKIETPEAPYFKETQFEGQDTQLALYYYQTADLQKLSLDIQKDGEDAFCEKYGIVQFSKFIQIDAKFNDGEWISTKGNWDKMNEYEEQDYGENMNSANLNFLLEDVRGNDNADKLLSFTQSWITYFEADNPDNDFFKPFVKIVDKDGGQVKIFDFTETTITYRIRSVVRYLINQYTENEQWVVLTSDWSPETSYGKNGTQQELKMPEKLDAPVLSEFELKANEDGNGEIYYFASLPDSIYQAERYQLIVNDGFEPYITEVQVKINDGDWEGCSVANATWMNNGYRSAAPDNNTLKVTDDAWIRVRVVSTQNESEKSEWSNIIGTKAIEGEDNPKTSEGKTDLGALEKTKCKVCGICPIQPLGICMFIWLAIILVIVLVLVIVVVVAKKNKKKK